MTHDSTQQILSQLTTRFPGVPVGPDGTPRYHFFHAPNSGCSQKVRAVLAYYQVSHCSHLLDIFAGKTYDPAQVHVRMQGCACLGVPLAAQHLGTTSVEANGCDGCVVPTLVDVKDGTFLWIPCAFVKCWTPRKGGGALVPAALRAAIMAELAVVHDLPNYQSLAVRVVPESAPGNALPALRSAIIDVPGARLEPTKSAVSA
ncbi:hypothetical protein [Falsihalocynthiibacter arcticus]|uniref:hypothetical protein n=1 Tax=Falsihalocynthiibacter arcticus TaxID=1579316 RepID=UPI0012E96172|nr:hypothetical protein [Falsihalocynthiibacter arcticus]